MQIKLPLLKNDTQNLPKTFLKHTHDVHKRPSSNLIINIPTESEERPTGKSIKEFHGTLDKFHDEPNWIPTRFSKSQIDN